MKVSLNIIKQYIDFELPPTDELVERINSQLGKVEVVIDLNDKYKDAKIVRVVECEKHPNADRLNVTKIDAGTGELIQVVCGAPNVHADMWAVWLPPESTVPATYDDTEPFKLGARELRGVMSYGMLAAADELALGSDHEGILEIDPDEWKPGNVVIEPGVSFAQVYELDDTVVDIENKMFTHRPDLFGQLGVAREIAGIFGHQFKSPDWYINTPKFEDGEGLKLEAFNDVTEKVPRFMAVAMKDVMIKPSPVWLQCALVAMGGKPINNIVDVTNYVMLLTAQPTHAYDYDKIRGAKIGARMAKKGETVKLLNDKTYELTPDDIVIVDAEGPIALGGIMGGGESEVDETTKNIVLEVATFDMYAVRKSSMRHGIFTDALTRFNKGQSPLQNDHVMAILLQSILDVAAGEQAGEVNDFGQMDLVEPIIVTDVFVNERLGCELRVDEQTLLLDNVELGTRFYKSDIRSVQDVSIELDSDRAESGDKDVQGVVNSYTVTPPFWRTDLELPEDIVEEVGRLHGFDKLPRELPQRSTSPAPLNNELVAKQRLRTTLAQAGGNEILTYSFVHADVLRKAGQDAEQAFKLSNALSPDLQYYRLSMLPSLLDKVHMNVRAGYDQFMLYEIGKSHHVDMYGEDGLPQAFGRAAAVVTDKNNQSQAAYYQAKRVVEYTVASILPGTAVTYTRLDKYQIPDFKPFTQLLAPFDPVRTAIVEIDGKLAGVVGEFRSGVIKNFKLPQRTGGLELFVSPFMRDVRPKYLPLSRYPSVQRDVSFRVDQDIDYGVIEAVIQSADVDRAARITHEPLTIYQAQDATDKTVTLRFVMTSHNKTLDSKEASELLQKVIDRVVAATDARVV